MSIYNINIYTDASGVVWVTIHCGCCGLYFDAPRAGTCFCKACRDGEHKGCNVPAIMGIKS